jgi:hypothetical protein
MSSISLQSCFAQIYFDQLAYMGENFYRSTFLTKEVNVTDTQKMVIVVSSELPAGHAANVVGLLGISLGHHIDGIVGPDIEDARGVLHKGMSARGLPVVTANEDALHNIHMTAIANARVRVFDVTDAATQSRDYDAYTARLSDPHVEWKTLGLAIIGPRQDVDALTGRLRLLR